MPLLTDGDRRYKLVDTFRTVAADDEDWPRSARFSGAGDKYVHSRAVAGAPVEEGDESLKKLEAKRAEAELLRRQKEEDNFANFFTFADLLEEVLMKDFCLPIAPPSPREEDIKPTADGLILACRWPYSHRWIERRRLHGIAKNEGQDEEAETAKRHHGSSSQA